MTVSYQSRLRVFLKGAGQKDWPWLGVFNERVHFESNLKAFAWRPKYLWLLLLVTGYHNKSAHYHFLWQKEKQRTHLLRSRVTAVRKKSKDDGGKNWHGNTERTAGSDAKRRLTVEAARESFCFASVVCTVIIAPGSLLLFLSIFSLYENAKVIRCQFECRRCARCSTYAKTLISHHQMFSDSK